MAENAPGAIFECRMFPDGTIRYSYFNARLPEITGASHDAIAADGTAVFQHVPDEDLQAFGHALRTAVETGVPLEFKHRVNHPEKGERSLVVFATPSVHADGTVDWYGNVIDITDQTQAEKTAKQADEAVRIAHDRLNTLADNANGALFEYRVSAEGHVSLPYFSGKLPDIMGVSRDEIEADPTAFERTVPAEDFAKVHRMLEEAGRSLTPVTMTHRVDHPTKGMRWVVASVVPARQADASTVFYSSIVDVTEQKTAERQAADAAEALRGANNRFLNMAEKAPAAIFECHMTLDGDFDFKFLSSALLDLMGVERDAVETRGVNMFARVPPEDAGLTQPEIMRCARELQPYEVRHRVQHPEKGIRWVIASANPKGQPDGSVIWYGSVVDVTERMEIETRAARWAEDLKRAHDRLNLVADISTAAIYEYRKFPDGSSDFPYTSARFSEMVGYSREEIERLKDAIFLRVHPDDLPTVVETIDTSKRDRAGLAVRFRILHPERGTIWVAASAKAPREEEGVFFWSATLVDITSDVEREDELRKAHRLAEDMRAENERQALHDGLTGLPNRRFYDKLLTECQRRSKIRPGGGAKPGQWRSAKRHGARAPEVAGACHGALARRANLGVGRQLAASALRARLWPSR